MEEKGLSKCRKDKDYDLCHRPGHPAEFRQVSMRSLSHWSGQQQHLLKQLQALGAQEMQRAQALGKDPDYRCTQCQGTVRALVGRPQRKVQVEPIELEVVATSCYLGDMLSAADGCELTITTRVKTAWKKIKELLQFSLPATSLSRHVAMCTGVECREQMLHASETWKTWPLTKPNLEYLQRIDRAIIRQICNVKPQDIVTTRSSVLLVRVCTE